MVFYGDHMWSDRFGTLFDRSKGYPSHNLKDFDTLDNSAAGDILKELDNGSDFKLMIGHILGIDSAGHTVGPFHKELERKLRDTSEIIHSIVDKMDRHTTLIIFGDHGMTNNGDHGGSSELELRTILFAHQKTPFPMHEHRD